MTVYELNAFLTKFPAQSVVIIDGKNRFIINGETFTVRVSITPAATQPTATKTKCR